MKNHHLASRSLTLASLASLTLGILAPSLALADDTAVTTTQTAKQALEADLNKGFHISTPGGAAKLQIAGVAQARADVRQKEDDSTVASFSVPIMRPLLRGSLGAPWLQIFIQPELAKDQPKLLDMALSFELHEAFKLRIGQFITPFSREFLTPLPALLFPDFSPADVYFRAGRDTGIMVYGNPWQGRFEYALGLFNGDGINTANDDTDFETIGRLVFNPLGPVNYTELPTLQGPQPFRLSFGVDGLRGQRTTTLADGSTQKNTWYSASADTTLRYRSLHAEGELYYRQGKRPLDVGERAIGGYAQTGLMVMPQTLELGLRYSLVDPDMDVKDNNRQTYEGVIDWYILGNHIKLQTSYGMVVTGGKLYSSATAATQLMF